MLDEIKAWREYLDKPDPPADLVDPYLDDAYFNPWEWFPGVYGHYSSEFDAVALRVLINMYKAGSPIGEGVAHEMFREMLCTSGIADYGSSPRHCFFVSALSKAEIYGWILQWANYIQRRWHGGKWPVSELRSPIEALILEALQLS